MLTCKKTQQQWLVFYEHSYLSHNPLANLIRILETFFAEVTFNKAKRNVWDLPIKSLMAFLKQLLVMFPVRFSVLRAIIFFPWRTEPPCLLLGISNFPARRRPLTEKRNADAKIMCKKLRFLPSPITSNFHFCSLGAVHKWWHHIISVF